MRVHEPWRFLINRATQEIHDLANYIAVDLAKCTHEVYTFCLNFETNGTAYQQ